MPCLKFELYLTDDEIKTMSRGFLLSQGQDVPKLQGAGFIITSKEDLPGLEHCPELANYLKDVAMSGIHEQSRRVMRASIEKEREEARRRRAEEHRQQELAEMRSKRAQKASQARWAKKRKADEEAQQEALQKSGGQSTDWWETTD